jgi:hypothetical protein
MATESADDLPAVVVHLTEQQLEEIIKRVATDAATKAAQKTLDEAQHRFVYQVGIGVLKKVAWVIGMGLLVLGLMLAGRDFSR